MSPEIGDPLSGVIELLRPRSVVSKPISGAGTWAVRYSAFGQPGFCVVLEGACLLAVDGHPTVTLEQGDFVLLPTTPGFTMSSGAAAGATPRYDPKNMPPSTGEVRHGDPSGPADVRLLGGSFTLGNPDASLLVALLPALVHVRGVSRLALLLQLVDEEARGDGLGHTFVLARLVDILLVEALRASTTHDAPGLLRGLGDARLAPAIRRMHAELARPWTGAELAKATAMSRSGFFERFTRVVGLTPIAYLLMWRMAVAKDLLHRSGLTITEVAERVGYRSASAFSTAFSRHFGRPPGGYARAARARPGA